MQGHLLFHGTCIIFYVLFRGKWEHPWKPIHQALIILSQFIKKKRHKSIDTVWNSYYYWSFRHNIACSVCYVRNTTRAIAIVIADGILHITPFFKIIPLIWIVIALVSATIVTPLWNRREIFQWCKSLVHRSYKAVSIHLIAPTVDILIFIPVTSNIKWNMYVMFLIIKLFSAVLNSISF